MGVTDNKDEHGAADPTIDQWVIVQINITNVDEAGTVTLSSADPTSHQLVTATVTDIDGGVSGTTWQWARSSDWDGSDGTWTDIAGATGASYRPVVADEGNYLRATASYEDAEGKGKTASAVSTSDVAVGVADQPGALALDLISPAVDAALTATLTDDPDGGISNTTVAD